MWVSIPSLTLYSGKFVKWIEFFNSIYDFSDVYLTFFIDLGYTRVYFKSFYFRCLWNFSGSYSKSNFCSMQWSRRAFTFLTSKRFKTDLLFNWTRNLQGRIWTEAIIDRYQNYSTYKKTPRSSSLFNPTATILLQTLLTKKNHQIRNRASA